MTKFAPSIRLRALLASAVILVWTAPLSRADAGVPSRLLGKTINASINLSMQAQAVGEGRPMGINGGKKFVIYISTEGRVFVRYDRDNRGSLHTRYEDGPETATFHFVGEKLVSTTPAIAGAVTYQISFDQGFKTCTIQAIHGREAGQHFKWIGLDGKAWEALSAPTYSDERCSITVGNGLQ
jgi:hypothetical protein